MPTYQFKTLDFASANSSHLTGISDTGLIVGDEQLLALGPISAFVDNHGTFTAVTVPNGLATTSGDVNNNSQLAGTNTTPFGTKGFTLNPDLYTPIRVTGATDTSVHGSNDKGQLVGTYRSAGVDHAFKYAAGHFTNLDLSGPGFATTNPEDINNNGVIVGSFEDENGDTHGFVKDHATYSTVDVAGATATRVEAIDDKGRLVGDYDDATGTHGFFRNVLGQIFTFDAAAPDLGGTGVTKGLGIDSQGNIVGSFSTSAEAAAGVQHGFVASHNAAGFTALGVDPTAAATLTFTAVV